MLVYYAVTVKNNTNKRMPTVHDYEMWVCNAINKGMEFMQVAYELDKSNRIHLHAVMCGPPNLFYRKLMFNNFHQLINPIESHNALIGWVKYIEKENQYYVEQEATRQELASGYPFITA